MVVSLRTTCVCIFFIQCQVAPKCSCTFGSESVDVEEQTTGSEALSGAVGALGSALLTGGGFSVWYLLKGRKDVVPEFDDQDDLPPTKRGNHGPPEYSTGSEQVRAKNVYTAGIGDNLAHKVARTATNTRATDF